MAQLQWALVAESARLDSGGTVSLLGGGFTRLLVNETPTQVPLSIVGRVLFDPGEDPAPLRLVLVGPNGTFKIGIDSQVAPTEEKPVDDTPRATMFVISSVMPIPMLGLFAIQLSVDRGDTWDLNFQVAVQEPQPPA